MKKIGLIIKKKSKNLSQIIRLIEDLLIQNNSSAYCLESDQKYFLKSEKKIFCLMTYFLKLLILLLL